MKKIRLAAIDIGTNSIRCIVVEVGADGRFMVLDDEKATVRLGESMGRTGAVSPAASARAIEAMERIRKLVEGLKVSEVEAVATSAMRTASNGGELVQSLSAELGRHIRIISGEEEAELVAVSALYNFDMKDKRYGMIDIGGGSVEIVSALGNHLEEFFSLELGAVTMTEQFFPSDPIKTGDYLKFRKHLRALLKKRFAGDRPVFQTLIGSGGTVTSIGAMVMNMRRQAYSSVHGYSVLRSEVVHLLAMLMRRDIRGRRAVLGLNPDRSDIIVAGLGVVDELMRFFGANTLVVNERGIREGLIIRAMKQLNLIPEAARQRTWRESMLEFARSCQFDEPHSRHVAMLSRTLFDGLATGFRMKKSERRLLEAAALLHDIGYFISYNSHHKHTYHLVRHADLFGFTPREREIVAQVARYHRKALPKKKHKEYQLLAERDRLLVTRLGGILRMADGLDRRRSGLVESLNVQHDGSTFKITLTATDDISVELFGADAKKDLFEKAFGGSVAFVTG